MRWADQLIKLSNFELELLQTRLSQIVERREQAEMKLVVLAAEGESEIALARADPEAARSLGAFREGLKLRMAAAQRDIDLAMVEESGARDALAEAFETLKKYEHVAESNRVAVARETARRETAVLDEMGLRRAAGRR
jgi:flagellar FliJ protein